MEGAELLELGATEEGATEDGAGTEGAGEGDGEGFWKKAAAVGVLLVLVLASLTAALLLAATGATYALASGAEYAFKVVGAVEATGADATGEDTGAGLPE